MRTLIKNAKKKKSQMKEHAHVYVQEYWTVQKKRRRQWRRIRKWKAGKKNEIAKKWHS